MPPGSAGGRASNPTATSAKTPPSGTALRTNSLVASIRSGGVLDADDLYNAFDRVLAIASPEAGDALTALRAAHIPAIACGSGPAVFVLAPRFAVESAMPEGAAIRVIACRTIGRDEALAVDEA
jgi:hypothetical protein